MTTDRTARTLDPTYAIARRRFLDAAGRSGADVSTFIHPSAGLEGEDLAIDVAQLGDDAAASVLLIVSATHGVEGYAGSALQSWWLDERAADLDLGRTRVVMIHGFNPVGFSWVRRVNEDNVDLNRNFVDWASPPTNAEYGEIADLLVPSTWSDDAQASTTTALLEVAGEIGLVFQLRQQHGDNAYHDKQREDREQPEGAPLGGLVSFVGAGHVFSLEARRAPPGQLRWRLRWGPR